MGRVDGGLTIPLTLCDGQLRFEVDPEVHGAAVGRACESGGGRAVVPDATDRDRDPAGGCFGDRGGGDVRPVVLFLGRDGLATDGDLDGLEVLARSGGDLHLVAETGLAGEGRLGAGGDLLGGGAGRRA